MKFSEVQVISWDSMQVNDLVTPIASTDWDKGELGANESTLNSDLHFLRELDAEIDVAIVVTDNDDSLKAGTVTVLGLLLDRQNLYDLIGEGTSGLLDELVNIWGPVDCDGVRVDLLKVADASVLDEKAELGEGNLFILASAAWATTTTTVTTVITESTALLLVFLCWLLRLSFNLRNLYENLNYLNSLTDET